MNEQAFVPATISRPAARSERHAPTARVGRRGILRFGVPGAQVEADEDLNRLAGLVALLLVSKRDTSDSYSQLVRRRRMEVSAEMEWQLMPPRTFATDRVLISAIMEPAYQVSGDVDRIARPAKTA
ncbi:hypothetical protein AB0P40_21860 [Streptomyces sp. NPDC079189]|uniref:hypothetical protein n=1 Tax=Streptomyces sp. NPDC079189 TaxID=3154514 RepID=UPI0034307600